MTPPAGQPGAGQPPAEEPRARAGWRAAVSMFTIIPAGQHAGPRPGAAAAILAWLPAVGLLLAIPGAAIMLGADAGGGQPARGLLGATVAVASIAVLTGGLHLDGLADTADGLGSRRPAGQALEIMRRSDTGPMGVAALVLTVLAEVFALAAISPGWLAAAGLAAAAVTGRVAVVLASGGPPARPDGFGALMTGSTPKAARLAAGLSLVAAACAAGAAAGGPVLALRAAAAVLAGLGTAAGLAGLARRRLGGMTGDVFGAMIEVGTAAVLVVLAATG